MEDFLNLYMVYWKQGERKALVKGKNEEGAINEAKRFAGKHTKIFKIDKINLSYLVENIKSLDIMLL